jgi:transmembrane sensor
MDLTKLDELIEKYASGEITPEELQELLDWYRAEEIGTVEWPAEHPEERDHLQQRMLRRLQNQIRTGMEMPGGPLTPVIPIAPPSHHTGRRIRPFRLRGWHVAASLIVIVSAFWVARQYLDLKGHPVYITVSNPSGKIRAIRLPDSSQVWLNAASSIRYAQAFVGGQDTRREIFLDGEGYFDVATDQAHPFIVHSGALTTTVLGTRFDVKSFAGEQQASVTVIRGKVQVSDSTRSLDVLTPARQLQVDTRTGKTHNIAIDTNSVAGWQQGKLEFAGQTMEEVAASLGRWYNIAFTFADPSIRRCRYYLNFENTISLEQLLAALKEATDMNFQLDKARHTVTISGKACQ